MRLKLETRTDVLLALLGLAANGVRGITRLVKLLFLAERECGADAWLAKSEEYYGYRPYKLGPFSADVYEDLELLEDAGLVEGAPSRAAIAEEIQEWRELFADDLGPEVMAPDQEVNRLFRLTESGQKCAASIIQSMPAANRDALKAVVDRYNRRSLRDLLVYVYTRYPEMTEASEIKRKLGLQ